MGGTWTSAAGHHPRTWIQQVAALYSGSPSLIEDETHSHEEDLHSAKKSLQIFQNQHHRNSEGVGNAGEAGNPLRNCGLNLTIFIWSNIFSHSHATTRRGQ